MNPKQEVLKISELLKNKLTIPDYQRPYKWTEKNVVQLLEDIFEYVVVKNKDYRIGNIILHDEKDKDEKNVVDGQQRLTTISLILKMLDISFEGLLMKQKYRESISKNNIAYNYRVITNWVNTKFKNNEEQNKFKDKILSKCEFVLFTVYHQDEAFQLFDSQNARGRSLEPYDLLKAFHLREMEIDNEGDRIKCIEKWETSVDNGTLKSVLGNHLFKIRKWSKNESKYDFTKDEIEEFKGISLDQKQQYPYETAIRILEGAVDKAKNDKLLANFNVIQIFPFQITMPIINGKRFFEYVDYYITLREKLFDFNKQDSIKTKVPEFVEFYEKYCNYPHSWRSGDKKVRNLYENLLIQFVDRFGFVEDFENFYKSFYKAAYIIRCNKERIYLNTILNSDARKICTEIKNATNPSKLNYHQYKNYTIEKTSVKGIGHIVDFINDAFINELKKALNKEKLEMDENSDYYFVPFSYSDKKINIYIGDKGNLYWYGFKNDKDLDKEIVEKIKKFEFDQNNNNWLGWNKFKNNDINEIPKIIEKIKNYIDKLKPENNGK